MANCCCTVAMICCRWLESSFWLSRLILMDSKKILNKNNNIYIICIYVRKKENSVIFLSAFFLLSKFEQKIIRKEKRVQEERNHSKDCSHGMTLSQYHPKENLRKLPSSSFYWCWIWENCIVNRGGKLFNVGNKSNWLVSSSLLHSSSLISIADEIAERRGEKIEFATECRLFRRIIDWSVILVLLALLLLLLLLLDKLIDSIDCCVKPKSWILNSNNNKIDRYLFK